MNLFNPGPTWIHLVSLWIQTSQSSAPVPPSFLWVLVDPWVPEVPLARAAPDSPVAPLGRASRHQEDPWDPSGPEARCSLAATMTELLFLMMISD